VDNEKNENDKEEEKDIGPTPKKGKKDKTHLKKVIKKISQDEFFERLKKVSLLNQSGKLPYAEARFEINLARPSELQPSTLYVLKSKLSFLAFLLDELSRHLNGIEKIDTLIEYQNEFGFWNQIIPPVVELTDFGEWMILDGEHRSFIAMQRKIEIPMLFIKNVTYPYPCLSFPGRWNSVKIVERTPEHKRILRKGLNDTPETRYSLHRDLRKFGSKGTRKPLSPI